MGLKAPFGQTKGPDLTNSAENLAACRLGSISFAGVTTDESAIVAGGAKVDASNRLRGVNDESGDDYVSDVESYTIDYSTGDMVATTAPSLSDSREYMVAAQIMNCVLLAGGKDEKGSSDIVELVTSFGKHEKCQPLSTARNDFAAASVNNNALFAGGCGNTTIEVYGSNFLKRILPLSLEKPLRGLCGVHFNGYAVFAGGRTFDGKLSKRVIAIDGNMNMKMDIPDLSVARYNLSAAVVANPNEPSEQYLFVAGGKSSHDGFETVVDIYDKDFNLVETELELSEGRSRMAAASIGGYVLFGGGIKGVEPNDIPSAIVDVFDYKLQSFAPMALSEARNSLSAAAVGDSIIFAGGYAGSSGTSAVVDRFYLGGTPGPTPSEGAIEFAWSSASEEEAEGQVSALPKALIYAKGTKVPKSALPALPTPNQGVTDVTVSGWFIDKTGTMTVPETGVTTGEEPIVLYATADSANILSVAFDFTRIGATADNFRTGGAISDGWWERTVLADIDPLPAKPLVGTRGSVVNLPAASEMKAIELEGTVLAQFGGFYLDQEATIPAGSSVTLSEDMTVYAKYMPVEEFETTPVTIEFRPGIIEHEYVRNFRRANGEVGLGPNFSAAQIRQAAYSMPPCWAKSNWSSGANPQFLGDRTSSWLTLKKPLRYSNRVGGFFDSLLKFVKPLAAPMLHSLADIISFDLGAGPNPGDAKDLVFVGYFTNSDCTEPWSPAPEMTGNVVVYCKFAKKPEVVFEEGDVPPAGLPPTTYTIQFDIDGMDDEGDAAGICPPGVELPTTTFIEPEVLEGAFEGVIDQFIPEPPVVMDGFNFLYYYYYDENGNQVKYDPNKKITQNMTLYPKFELIPNMDNQAPVILQMITPDTVGAAAVNVTKWEDLPQNPFSGVTNPQIVAIGSIFDPTTLKLNEVDGYSITGYYTLEPNTQKTEYVMKEYDKTNPITAATTIWFAFKNMFPGGATVLYDPGEESPATPVFDIQQTSSSVAEYEVRPADLTAVEEEENNEIIEGYYLDENFTEPYDPESIVPEEGQTVEVFTKTEESSSIFMVTVDYYPADLTTAEGFVIEIPTSPGLPNKEQSGTTYTFSSSTTGSDILAEIGDPVFVPDWQPNNHEYENCYWHIDAEGFLVPFNSGEFTLTSNMTLYPQYEVVMGNEPKDEPQLRRIATSEELSIARRDLSGVAAPGNLVK